MDMSETNTTTNMVEDYYDVQDDYLADSLPSPSAAIRGLGLGLLVFSVSLLSYWGDIALAKPLAIFSQLIVALLGISLFLSITLTDAKLAFPREFQLLFAFAIWSMIGVPVAIHPSFAVRELFTLFKLLLMAFVILNAVNGRSAYKWFLFALVASFFIASWGGITGLARGAETIMMPGTSLVRYEGLFGNPNGLGKLACLSIWASISLYFTMKNRMGKIILILMMLLGTVVVGWTGSRQSMLGLIVIMASTYWFFLRKSVRGIPLKILVFIMMICAFALLLVFLTKTPFWHRLAKIAEPGGMTEAGSAGSRLYYMIESLRTVAKHPFKGVGYGCMTIVLVGKSTHNAILGMLANTGIIGWFLFFGSLFVAMLRLRRIQKMPIPRLDWNLALVGWVLYTLLFFWSALTELHLYKPFWACFAANVGYMIWVERTYHSSVSEIGPVDDYQAVEFIPEQ